jgi:hypothetical protein
MGSDEPLIDLDPPRRSAEFDTAPVTASRPLRTPFLAAAFGAVLVGVVALAASGPRVEDPTGVRGVALGSVAPSSVRAADGAADSGPADSTGSRTINVASAAEPGSISLQVLPNGRRLSIIGAIAAEGVTSVMVSVYDSSGTVTDWRSLSIRHLGGGFRPDHWPAFAVTLQAAAVDTLVAVEAIAYDATGARLAKGHRFLGSFRLVTVPHALVVRD